MEISHLQEHDGVAVKILALNVKLVSFSIKIENRLKNVFGSVFNENAYETFLEKGQIRQVEFSSFLETGN